MRHRVDNSDSGPGDWEIGASRFANDITFRELSRRLALAIAPASSRGVMHM